MLPHLIFALAPVLSLLPSVAAHGFVTKVVIDGTTYTGNVPGAQPSNSPIRQISDISPVKGANNPSLNCGLNAQLAAMVVPANPGSVLDIWWGDPDGSNWPHNTGPLMTYMAKCDTTCDQFNGSTAQWFKIDQIGKKSDGTTWYLQDVMSGKPVSVTLPTNVAPGDYLVRHEIIALHLAVTVGGAEFYPSCTQIRISGSQTGTPNQTVLFPGAYNDNDPGIYDPNVFTPGSGYVFPGPPVSNLASPADMSGQTGFGGSASPSGSGGASTATTKGANPTSTSGSGQPSSSQSPSNRVCKLKKRNSASLSQRDTAIAHHKRHTSFVRGMLDAFYTLYPPLILPS